MSANTHPPTTPRTRLSGIGGWHSWKVLSFRAWLRAWRRATAFHAIIFEEIAMFQFQNTISVADVINAFLLIVAIIGIAFTYRQIRESHKTQKATFFKDLYSTMFSDPDVRNAYYQIEYGDFTYDENFHGSSNEKLIDRLLSFVDLVCDLYAQGIITEHEMSFFKYEFTRIYQNPNVQGYLEFLKNFYADVGTGTKPFASFVAYCAKVSNRR
jgi:hypothetical protein